MSIYQIDFAAIVIPHHSYLLHYNNLYFYEYNFTEINTIIKMEKVFFINIMAQYIMIIFSSYKK